MGRHAEGWRIRQKVAGGPYYVRFRHQGCRQEHATGSSDPREAAERAARIYADVIAERRVHVSAAPVATKARELFAEWIASLENTHAETTIATWTGYVNAHFLDHFEALADFNAAKLGAYTRHRLGQVLKATVKKERTALGSFLAWAKEQGYVAEVPPMPPMPKGATGKRATTRKERATELAPAEVEATLARLPVWSSESHPDRFPVRAYFRVLWETGLRPVTVQRLRAPEDFRRGSTSLQISDEDDKVRYGRTLPLTTAAVAALSEVAPASGLIFGKHDWRGFLRVAAREAGVDLAKIETFTPYDLRHTRTTHLLEETGNLPGVAFLVGHKQVTTTNRYARPNERAARAVLGEVSGGNQCEGRELNPYASYGASTSRMRGAAKTAARAHGAGHKSAPTGTNGQSTGEAPPKELPRLARAVRRLSAGWDALELAVGGEP